MFQGLHESLMKTVCAKLGEIVFTFHVNEKGIKNAIIFYQNQSEYFAIIWFMPKIILMGKLMDVYSCW